ncbi:hypothetical protein TCAL_12713 [Tigriopus californicus]|uniref:Chitin-binding type-2 domain-containing protein n=3 Tax=Tigriopus californicus TaxID=6832 RepID=A0A553PQJ5_TIGCA|nr:adhesive plaque matrix protein-like isoform X2 [Tigriopus californicus]TRY79952.1 hypothetical protein TCAL_12713 [Tigriopus californicus]
MKTFTVSILTLALLFGSSNGINHRVRRDADAELYRDAVNPADGGKVPESAHLRLELNKLDSLGLKDEEGIRMSDALKDTPLPDKLSGAGGPSSFAGGPSSFVGGSGYRPYSSGLSQAEEAILESSSQLFSDPIGNTNRFPFNPIFDSNKEHARQLPPSTREITPYLTDNLIDEADSPGVGGKSNYGGGGPVSSKGHLFVTDPYANHAPAHGYNPPSYEIDPYTPHEETPVYNPYKPAHDPYKPVHDPYKPYKPKGPVLLEKLPYEVKEIKPLSVSVHKTYTSFDCRKAPYLDRHYADPEAGCSIYHFCHKDGRQETFHCAHGTTFNEYLGTCDHAEAVYCTGGDGYAAPPKPHHESSYHESPKPHHETSYHHSNLKPSYHEPQKPVYHEPEPSYYQSPQQTYHEPETYDEPEPYYDEPEHPQHYNPPSYNRKPTYSAPNPYKSVAPSYSSSQDYEEPDYGKKSPYPRPSFGPAYEPTFDFPKLSGFKAPF